MFASAAGYSRRLRSFYAASTGFGGSGPNRDFLGMDITLQAVTGVMSITGEDGHSPLRFVDATLPAITEVPYLGAQNRDLYCGFFGLSEVELTALEECGAV